MTADLRALAEACAKCPDDVTAHLLYADALAEAGDELGACLYRCTHDPDNDQWRLQLASWLESQPEKLTKCPKCFGKRYRPHHKTGGTLVRCECVTGFVPDTAAKDRAEFLRAQVELARWESKPCECRFSSHNRSVKCDRCYPVESLQARERELLSRHPEWKPTCPACDGHRWQGLTFGGEVNYRCDHCSGTGRVGRLERGLLGEVEVPRLEDCIQRCRSIRHVWPAGTPWQEDKDCKLCKGLGWRATPWAAGLMRDPWFRCVRRVVVGDREPFHDGRYYLWFRQYPADAPASTLGHADLPVPVFDRLLGEGQVAAIYDTPDAARLALGEAVARALRALCPARH